MKLYILSEKQLNERDEAAIKYGIEGFKLDLAKGLSDEYRHAALNFQRIQNETLKYEIPHWGTHIADIRYSQDGMSFANIKLLQFFRIERIADIQHLVSEPEHASAGMPKPLNGDW